MDGPSAPYLWVHSSGPTGSPHTIFGGLVAGDPTYQLVWFLDMIRMLPLDMPWEFLDHSLSLAKWLVTTWGIKTLLSIIYIIQRGTVYGVMSYNELYMSYMHFIHLWHI